ncbi:MAG TPA: peptidoglycan editing factor PgeF [Rhizobiales bacterium]|nr:peptidoglycan editing factor PgeF [Hyphomicrobiales bacterium]
MIVESATLSNMAGIRHGFGTRKGGVSSGIYATLNCGVGSRDDQGDVAENRARLAKRLGASPGALVTPYQIHSAQVATAEKPWARGDAPRADGVVTARPGVAIAVSTADCVPVLFADCEAKVVGAAHAGWRGALSGILEAVLGAMEGLGADRARICATIGPAISQQAYEVGDEFEARFLAEDETSARFFERRPQNSRLYFNLTGYVAARLLGAGTGAVDDLKICTYGNSEHFFSYRRSYHNGDADYGRQISAILIS